MANKTLTFWQIVLTIATSGIVSLGYQLIKDWKQGRIEKRAVELFEELRTMGPHGLSSVVVPNTKKMDTRALYKLIKDGVIPPDKIKFL